MNKSSAIIMFIGLGVLFSMVATIITLTIMADNKVIDRCNQKGGILLKSQNGEYICASREIIIK